MDASEKRPPPQLQRLHVVEIESHADNRSFRFRINLIGVPGAAAIPGG